MKESKLNNLFDRCVLGSATAEEREEFLNLMLLPAHEEDAKELFERYYKNPVNLLDVEADQVNAIIEAITFSDRKESPKKITPSKKNLYVWYGAAASFSVVLLVTLYFFFIKQHEKAVPMAAANTKDIAGPGNKATLFLSDGSKVVLDDLLTGKVTDVGNVRISKLASGKIIYKVLKEIGTGMSLINTIETPKGGQSQIDLPDGTSVWLNSASSLKFPTVFSGGQRKIELSGEAYFEVAHNKAMPFKVYANGTEITVLGTHFNVMAYREEGEVSTTLLEGSVGLKCKNASTVINPGKQAKINGEGTGFEIREANLNQVMAWKNGYFVFDELSLAEVMRQISRSYDVKVIYGQDVNAHEFVGQINRKYSLLKVLRILELGGLEFELKDRQLLIKK